MRLLGAANVRGLTLISIWCWLNVLAMGPTLHEPVLVLFGFAVRGTDATLIKVLIFLNGVAMSAAMSARLDRGRVILIGWLSVMFASAVFTDLVPTCPLPVKVAAYQQVLFGGLLPYLYVTLMPHGNLLVLHAINAAVTAAIVITLVRRRSLFRKTPLLGLRRAAADVPPRP
jgi:hypothetical protein